MSSGIIFEIRNSSYAYHHAPALQSVSLQIMRGERLALLGANGSGKSTLLRILAGLSFPQIGEVRYLGELLSAERLDEEKFFYEFRRKIGMVFQNPDVQLFNASVFDEVAFGPLQLGWPKAEIREKVEAMLERMGVADLRTRAPHRLSGGEKKRVALASVLVMDPDVLLLDEPAAGLDPSSQAQMVELLSSWRGSAKTIVIATHDLDSLEDVADRCCLLDRGRIAAAADPLTILHDLRLLESTGLVRPHKHVHGSDRSHPHPHIHLQDLPGSPGDK